MTKNAASAPQRQMFDLASHQLTTSEKWSIEELLKELGGDISLASKRRLMDKIWEDCGCSNKHFDQESYAKFYNHPIWLLHGLYLESDQQSLSCRKSICRHIALYKPTEICDYGGGFGTLARIAANTISAKVIHVYEPHPPRYGEALCTRYPQISYIDTLTEERYDVLISTDVLEHTQDPISCLSDMVKSVKVGGHLVIANCFYPVICCHLPSTFHLRYSFSKFCDILGLERVGKCDGSHATDYKRITNKSPDWRQIRQQEKLSRALYISREARSTAKSIFAAAFRRFISANRKA